MGSREESKTSGRLSPDPAHVRTSTHAKHPIDPKKLNLFLKSWINNLSKDVAHEVVLEGTPTHEFVPSAPCSNANVRCMSTFHGGTTSGRPSGLVRWLAHLQ
eukprot:5325883-Pyramimonas_sp.AAC.1